MRARREASWSLVAEYPRAGVELDAELRLRGVAAGIEPQSSSTPAGFPGVCYGFSQKIPPLRMSKENAFHEHTH